MAIGTAAAILGAAVIGGGLSYASNRSATSTAANAANHAADQNTALNREIYGQTRADLAPYNAAGQTGMDALLRQLGLSPANANGQPPAAPASAAGQGGAQAPGAPTPDYGAYLQQHPDVAAGYDAYSKGNATGFGGSHEGESWDDWGYAPGLSREQFAQQYQEKTGAQAGYTVPTGPATATPAPAAQPGTDLMTAQRPQAPAAPDYQRPAAPPPPTFNRPADQAAPTFQRPQDAALPTYSRPDQGSFTDPGEIGAFKFDPATIMDDPGVAFRRKEAISAANQGFAARGLLQSGFAAKGVMDRASDLASQEYGNAYSRALQGYQANANAQAQNRTFARNVFSDDRNTTNLNYNSDRDYGTNLALGERTRADNIFKDDRNFADGQYRYNQDRADDAFKDDRSYGTNLWGDQRDSANANFNLDRNAATDAYRYGVNRTDNIFDTDRGFQAGRVDQQTGNLFQLTGIGQTAAAGTANAANNYAANSTANNNMRAQTTANAAIAGANNTSNLIGQGAQALGSYYGGRVF